MLPACAGAGCAPHGAAARCRIWVPAGRRIRCRRKEFAGREDSTAPRIPGGHRVLCAVRSVRAGFRIRSRSTTLGQRRQLRACAGRPRARNAVIGDALLPRGRRSRVACRRIRPRHDRVTRFGACRRGRLADRRRRRGDRAAAGPVLGFAPGGDRRREAGGVSSRRSGCRAGAQGGGSGTAFGVGRGGLCAGSSYPNWDGAELDARLAEAGSDPARFRAESGEFDHRAAAEALLAAGGSASGAYARTTKVTSDSDWKSAQQIELMAADSSEKYVGELVRKAAGMIRNPPD